LEIRRSAGITCAGALLCIHANIQTSGYLDHLMPHRTVAQRELSTLLGVLAHPLRLGIIFALEQGELDVGALQRTLGRSQSAVSQALSRLRAARLVVERRDGRHVFYRLALPQLASWLAGGFDQLEQETAELVSVHDALEITLRARQLT
jgi:DNA-binding transcriptional ArsR family regulator